MEKRYYRKNRKKERLEKTVLITNDVEDYVIDFICNNFEIEKIDYVTNKISQMYVNDPFPIRHLYRFGIRKTKPTVKDLEDALKSKMIGRVKDEDLEAIEQFRKNPEDFPHLISDREIAEEWLNDYKESYNLDNEIIDDYDLYDYQSMIRCLYTLIKREKKKGYRVLINLSSQYSAFVAACITVSMYIDNIKFVNGYHTIVTETVKKEGQSNADYYLEYLSNTEETVDVFNNVTMNLPISEIDIKRMKVFESIELKDRSNTNVVRNLIDAGIWFDQYVDSDGTVSYEGTSYEENITEAERGIRKRKEENFFKRKLVEGWKRWVEPDEDHKGRYKLKPEAEMYVKLFCPEDFEFTEYERYNKKQKGFEVDKVKVKKQWDLRKYDKNHELTTSNNS